MTDQGVRFPVAIVHYSAPPTPGEVGRVVAGQARSLVRAGYPVRLVVGTGSEPSPEVDLRRVPELASSHPRILAITEALRRGELPEDLESCVMDLAPAIGRELVGCGAVFVHECLTMPFNLPAAEAIWRLEKGSRGAGIPGSPVRRWVVWAHGCAAGNARYRAFDRKDEPWSLLRKRLPKARYVTPSESRRAALSKGLKVPKGAIEVVPNGVDVPDFLDLTDRVRELAGEMGLFEADVVLFSPMLAAERNALDRGLDIVRALSRSKRGFRVRWIVTGPPCPHEPRAGELLKALLAKRDALGLQGSVRFLSSEQEGLSPQVPEADLRGLYRLADVLMLPSVDEGYGLPVIEGAISRNLIVIGPAPALKEHVKGEKGVVVLPARESPSASARRIMAAVRSLPAWGLRRRAMRELSWEAVARDHLVPLVEGGRPGGKGRRR